MVVEEVLMIKKPLILLIQNKIKAWV